MSRQFFIQFKRHFYISAGVKRMCYSSVFRAALTSSGSGSQVPRMGTTKSARRRELASAGAGFLNTLLFMPPASTGLSHNTFRPGSVHQNSDVAVHGCKNQNIFSRPCAADYSGPRKLDNMLR
jgi:hypothetical protein